MSLPSSFRFLPDLPGRARVVVWGTMACGHKVGYERLTRRLLEDTWHCPLCQADRPLVWREWAVSGWLPVPR